MKKFLLLSFSLVLALQVWAQERTITGKVTSAEDGTALPGVNVVLKGTSVGTVTDSEGNYRLTGVPSSGAVLVFSFIGLQTQEVAVGERSVVDVSMAADITQLSEVVVTALGAQTEKKALGYAVTSISGSLVAQKAEADIGRLLMGKIPGVNITPTGGVSGSGASIVIRGYTTISGSNQPLFVVDGVPFNTSTNTQGTFTGGGLGTSSRFLDLDPNNVENVSVLKGLAAAVLYGEQGKNGVILITTKNGSKKAKPFSIDVSQSFFLNKIASIPTYQDNYGNGFDQNFGFFFSNWGPRFPGAGGTGLFGPEFVQHPYDRFADPTLRAQFPEFQGAQYEYKAYPDPSNFFRTGTISTTSLNIGGSRDNLSYNANFSFTDEEGFVPNNTLSKINGGVGINANVTPKFNINTTMNIARTEMMTPPISTGGGSGPSGSGISVLADVLYTPRSVDLMGLPFEAPADHRSVYYRSGNDIQNPRWTTKYSRQTDEVSRFYGQTSFTYNITDEFSVLYRVGLDTYNEYQQYWSNKGGVQGVISQQGVYQSVSGKNTIWNHDFIANYNTKLSEVLSLGIVAGAQIRQDTYEQDGMESQNQVVFGLINHNNFINHASTTFQGFQIQYQEENIRQGIYGEATLGYNEYLYLKLAARNDWSSTLEKANRSIFYPSASVSFLPATAFGIESNFLNYWKVRVGYGTSAGFPPPYSTRNTLFSDARSFVDVNGNVITVNAASSRLGNPNLKPELQKEFEVGTEAQFFNKRVGVDLTLYTRDTEDLITDAPLDPATGFGVTRINIGRLNTKGIELTLDGVPVQMANGFTWDVKLNWSLYRSIIKELGGGLSQIQVDGFIDPGNYAIVGKPFNVIQGSRIERLNGQRVVDSNGDWLFSDDIGIIGNPNPDWVSALINNFSWKGFVLSAQLEYRHGGDIYSATTRTMLARGITKDTDFDRDQTMILPGVLQDGTPNTIQTSISTGFFNNIGFGPSEVSIFDGTTIRLREVSLGYTLPKSLLSKTPVKGATITFLGQNLWYRAVNFPKYVNFDTDVLSTGVSNGLGLELITGPSSRRYGVSLRINL
ncbi:MAG: SusC/RagA family TonB-linked outer membrane protein [Flammeovirgaceae bacterium]|nr:MAG: SusC/RagA family TonB-linked outer membrane protein [Flammeovirgaceae bacterium]